MPCVQGRIIPPEVLMGTLWHCGIRTSLIVSTAFPSNLTQARNTVKLYAETELVLMLDNDVVLPPRSLEGMASFLDCHPDFGAIALAKYPSCVKPILNNSQVTEPNHVDMSCVLWRKDILHNMEFRTTQDSTYCDCLPACEDLRKAGHRIGFMPKWVCTHFENTDTGLSVAQQAVLPTITGLMDKVAIQQVLKDYGLWWINKKGVQREAEPFLHKTLGAPSRTPHA